MPDRPCRRTSDQPCAPPGTTRRGSVRAFRPLRWPAPHHASDHASSAEVARGCDPTPAPGRRRATRDDPARHRGRGHRAAHPRCHSILAARRRPVTSCPTDNLLTRFKAVTPSSLVTTFARCSPKAVTFTRPSGLGHLATAWFTPGWPRSVSPTPSRCFDAGPFARLAIPSAPLQVREVSWRWSTTPTGGPRRRLNTPRSSTSPPRTRSRRSSN
jgi:hypothetical protein